MQNLKLNQLLKATLKQTGRSSFAWNFNLEFLAKNFELITEWQTRHGLFGGRSRFLFPEYSNHVFLGSNTLSMLKICPANHGYGHDIFALRGNSDNPERNHWIYEDPDLTEEFAKYSVDFLANYDGVHTLLKNRAEVYNGATIPVINHERKEKATGEVAPGHLHHNWRFRNQ